MGCRSSYIIIARIEIYIINQKLIYSCLFITLHTLAQTQNHTHTHTHTHKDGSFSTFYLATRQLIYLMFLINTRQKHSIIIFFFIIIMLLLCCRKRLIKQNVSTNRSHFVGNRMSNSCSPFALNLLT